MPRTAPRTAPLAAVAVLAATCLGAAAMASSPDPRSVPAGCVGGGPAVAHYADARVLRPQPGIRPVACGVSTGFGGAESHIVVTRSGAVVFTPAVLPHGLLGTGTAPVDADSTTQSNASPAGLAVSRDDGRHWRVVRPSGVTWNPTDHGDYADPATGRLFFEDYGPIPVAPQLGAEQEGPAHVMWSGDDGRSWHHTAIATLFLPENPKFVADVAPAGQPRPHGYPNVVYFCANTNVGFTSPVIAGRLCFRSLDGGSSWQQRGVLFTGTVPQHRECGTHPETYSAIDGYYPQAARDGSLYVMVACGGVTYLARSTDEAASFPILHRRSGAPVTLPVPTPTTGLPDAAPAELRITDDDTMYVMYAAAVGAGSHLFLRASSDLGRSWSRAYDVTAPGVSTVSQWEFAAAGRNTVTVAYLGHRRGQSTWDGYLTGSWDAAAALDRRGPGPLLFSARVNDPHHPLLYGSNVQGAGFLQAPLGLRAPFPPPFDIQVFGNDFIGATVGPDAAGWGSFTEDCGPTASSAGCARTHDQTRGFAGRLAWP